MALDIGNAVVRNVNCLVDHMTSVRKAALYRLADLFQSCSKSETEEICTDFVLKALLQSIADSSEQCRHLALSILLKLLNRVPESIVSLLPYIMPVLSERLPLQCPPNEAETEAKTVSIEPSEEVRLLLVRLISSLIDHAPRMLHVYAAEIASIIMVLALDSYPEVLLETMSLLESLTILMDRKIKPISKNMVSITLKLLIHKRYRVRVAALRAIRCLVLCGAHESIYELTAYQDPNMVPVRAFYEPYVKTQYFALLATDKSTSVRQEFLLTVANWLLKLDERKQHEVRLLPYIISAFNDIEVEIQQLAFQLMEEIGLQYEKENEKEVTDLKQYFAEYMKNISIGGKPLPSVFKCRPCLGARLIVRNYFSVLLHAVRSDLQSFIGQNKDLSAKFLSVLLIFIEENATMHLEPLCNLFIKACGNKTIQTMILECAQIVGFNVDPSAYLPIIIAYLRGDVAADNTTQYAGWVLQVLSSLITGTPSEKLASHVSDICLSLSEPQLLSSLDTDVNIGIVKSCKALIDAGSNSFEDVFSLLWIILNAIAVIEFKKESSKAIEDVLADLARVNGHNSSNGFLIMYSSFILNMLPNPNLWIMRSLQSLIYHRLLRAALACAEISLHRLVLARENCGGA